MGKWVHRLSNIDSDNKTAICANCGEVRICLKGKVWKCYVAESKWKHSSKFIGPKSPGKFMYRKLKKDTCERCGFIPENRCQLDVHHMDGNNRNNQADNLQTLCANCHRYITWLG